MSNQPDVGMLIIASAGAENRAQQAIDARNHSGKGLVYLWTGTRTDGLVLPVGEGVKAADALVVLKGVGD